MWDVLWTDVRLATMAGAAPYGAVGAGAIAVAGRDIAWVGPARDLPGRPEALARRIHRGQERWLTPGLIDCHTHLVFAGDRVREFELRIEGATRADLAAQGGGILETMRRTRAAERSALLASAGRRLLRLMAEGVTTVEIKSGYGLDLDTELRMLEVARELGRVHPVTVVTSFLGAHALPPEYAGRSEAYMDFLCETALPEAVRRGLVDICDGVGERTSFSIAEMAKLFARARGLGLPVRAHADQYADAGGAALVAEFQGLSADHLEHVSAAGVARMAEAGTVAVLLPGSTFFLCEQKRPPLDLFRRHGVPVALATNCNPGSSPVLSPLLVMALACTLFRMTPEEALGGFTAAAARALGRADRVGTLERGKQADFVLWDVERPSELAYWMGAAPCAQVVQAGRIVRGPDADPACASVATA